MYVCMYAYLFEHGLGRLFVASGVCDQLLQLGCDGLVGVLLTIHAWHRETALIALEVLCVDLHARICERINACTVG
jgi:hypothetical protein